MKIRNLLITLAILVVFITAIASIKIFQFKAAMAQQMSFQPPPEAVTTVVAKQEGWNSSLHAIGTVEAVNGVPVSADLPRIRHEILFQSRHPVNKGDVLRRPDPKEGTGRLA